MPDTSGAEFAANAVLPPLLWIFSHADRASFADSVGGKAVLASGVSVMPQDVFGFVPSEATMIGGDQVSAGSIKGRNTYMNVIFANTALLLDVSALLL